MTRQVGGRQDGRSILEQVQSKMPQGDFESSRPTRMTPPASAGTPLAPDRWIGEQPGDWIGSYKLLEVLGEGGFGVVWLAERREPMVQRVALKIIKPGMDSRAVIARFEQERQALAVMDHPNVAKVLDGGVTPAGRPYFVMELVRGWSITEFCDRRCFTNAQRLGLFVGVCGAVQHAHMKGIIHRDLKPSNILVTTGGDDQDSGVPGAGETVVKVIDFGVAKAIGHALTDKTIFTQSGQIIGTPEYMSPEQAQTGDFDVDTRTDVYSLGVVLYELLCGTLPFDSASLRDGGHAGIQRIIGGVDPPRPSTRVATMDHASGTAFATARRSSREVIARDLRRELEWIPLKAMRKDRRERYATPRDLGDDIRRYLNGEALEAGPESALYRSRKFIRRHRGRVIAAGGALLLCAMAFGVTVDQRNRALAHAAAETRARLRAEAIGRFVTAALQSSDPSSDGGSQQTTILQAMESAVKDIDAGRFADDPESQASLLDTISTIVSNNGDDVKAESLSARALEIRQRLYKGDHAEVAESLNNLATVRDSLGRHGEAEPLYVQALEMRQRLYKGDHADVATSLNNLGSVRESMGNHGEAERLYTLALGMFGRLAGEGGTGDSNIAGCLSNLAHVREAMGRLDEAETMSLEALEMQRRIYGADRPEIATSLNNLAHLRNAMGRPAEAESMYLQSLEMTRRLYKVDHPDIVMCLHNLAKVKASLGRAAEAVPLAEEALAMAERIYPPEHENLRSCRGLLEACVAAAGSRSKK